MSLVDGLDAVALVIAFRLATRAEKEAGDVAASAKDLSPSRIWRSKLERMARAHHDCVETLTAIPQRVAEMILQPSSSPDGGACLGALDSDPLMTWPSVIEQLIVAEQDAARCHDDVSVQYRDVLAASAHAFERAAKKDRAAAAELRSMLDLDRARKCRGGTELLGRCPQRPIRAAATKGDCR
jgi:hypothetical protein